MREAKRRGLFVVHEQVINPHVGRILREERARFPGIEAQDSLELVERGITLDEEQWRLADLVLGASEFVRREVLEHGIAPERVAVVPYGIHASWLTEPSSPQPGRISWAPSASEKETTISQRQARSCGIAAYPMRYGSSVRSVVP